MPSPADGFPNFELPAPIVVDVAPASCGTDRIEAGMERLKDRMRARAGKPIVYLSGDREIALCATYGPKLLRLSDGEGNAWVEWTDMSFVVAGEDLTVSGARVEPRRGDRIVLRAGDDYETFEVLPFGGEPLWRWCDPYRKQLRVHTKRVAVEPYS